MTFMTYIEKKLQTYRIFLILHISHQSYFNISGHIMDDFQNTICTS